MFGLAAPCRHSLPGRLHDAWAAHLCGLCLTLRDHHGHASRIATNVDAVLVSVLVAAQRPAGAATRTAGACALRGMRSAEVIRADAPGVRLAAGVSLLLAGGAVADHGADGDLPRLARPAAARLGRRWERRGAAELASLGLAAGPLAGVAERQARVERTTGATARETARVAAVLAVTAPAEEAVATAFVHTATLADRPWNAVPLEQAGRLVGRVAHLADAVVDRRDDDRRGRWNPLTATGTSLGAAVAEIEAALIGIRTAVARLDLPGRASGAPAAAALQAELAVRLLTDVLPRSVHRLLSRAGHSISVGGCRHRGTDRGDRPVVGLVADPVVASFGTSAGPSGEGDPELPAWGTPAPGFPPPDGAGEGEPGPVRRPRNRCCSWADCCNGCGDGRHGSGCCDADCACCCDADCCCDGDCGCGDCDCGCDC